MSRTIAFVAAAALCIALVAAAARPDSGDAGTRLVKPNGLMLLINGKRQATTPLNGSDKYVHISPGNLRVEARWTTNARNTGYHVAISTSTRVYRRCFVGTSCLLPAKVFIGPNQELTWTVKLLKTKTLAVAGGFRVCLSTK